MYKYLLFSGISLMLMSTQGFAETYANVPTDTSTPSSTPSNHALTFQVIQDQFVLDNSTVKSASIIEADGGIYKGLNIQLKPEASSTFTDMTKAGLGRKINLVYNNVVVTATAIQTPLGDNFLISGISRQDAQAFLNVLNANKPVKEEPTE